MPATTTTKPRPKAKAPRKTNAEKLAEVVSRDFDGKARFKELADQLSVQRDFKCKGSLYRHLQGIVTRDQGKTFTRTGPGEVKVKAGRSK